MLFFSGPPWPLFSPGPPWPLIARCPFPCCSFPTWLRVNPVAMCFLCLFVSFAILFPLVFPSLLAPLLSSPLLFLCGGLVLLVPELMALCSLLPPLFFPAQFTGCHSILACALLSLCDFWRRCFCRSAPFLICIRFCTIFVCLHCRVWSVSACFLFIFPGPL